MVAHLLYIRKEKDTSYSELLQGALSLAAGQISYSSPLVSTTVNGWKHLYHAWELKAFSGHQMTEMMPKPRMMKALVEGA